VNIRMHRPAALMAALFALLIAAGCNKSAPPTTAQNQAQAESQETTDSAVSSAVKTALLQNSDLRTFDITVVTTKGDVRLTGKVDTQAQISTALGVARAVQGVHSIHDELTLKKEPGLSGTS
jgi:hyperosmotically inducible periplasmic protein